MFFRRGNKVTVDFKELYKDSRTGVIEEFNNEGIVIKYEEDEKTNTVFIPMTSISEVVLVEEVDNKYTTKTTQY